MHAERSGQIAHVLVAAVEMIKRQSEERLLQWNGFQNQLFSCDRAVARAGSGAKPMPETEQTRVQGEKVAAESLRLRRFRNLQYAENVALEMCPAELACSRMVFQIRGTAVAAKDSCERGPQ